MIKAKYYKDYNHNYMILECEDISGDAYKYRILAANKIERILKCSIRDINGDTYFYYDISSKVSIENLYKGKFLSYEQVRDFMFQLDMIYKNLGQFFMDEKGLVLQSDCIYYDLASGKYFGLYYPGKKIKEGNVYEELMDFIIKHIDNQDQKLIDNIYQIYEMSENQNFMLANALQLFDEPDMDITDIKNIIETAEYKKEEPDVIGEDFKNISPEYEADNNYYKRDSNQNERLLVSDETEKNIYAKQNSGKKYYKIFSVLSLLGALATTWVYFNYKLTQKELMMIICCFILMLLCFVFSLIKSILNGRSSIKKEQEELELRYDIEDEFREEREPAVQAILDKSTSIIPEYAEKDRYGETVFVDVKKQKIEYKLYALDKKNKKHIELTQFPFTIGKMAGCVDCVLMDDSVSRLHARIEKQDEKIFLTDMNSTNGTYKNGLRMEPSETVELEPGDEIRFGRLNFCYR